MKKLLTIISFFISLIFSQEISSMNAWENILQTPELVKYFDGIFNHLGIYIEETNESFTPFNSVCLILKKNFSRKSLASQQNTQKTFGFRISH